MWPYLLIALAGVLGANARYLVSTWVANRAGVGFPYGTFLINASGSFAIGLLLELIADRFGNNSDARFIVATGFLGAYTTFSTFGYETVALIRQGAIRLALVNALGSAAVGVAGAGLGIAIGSQI
jgi:fluoride exporter